MKKLMLATAVAAALAPAIAGAQTAAAPAAAPASPHTVTGNMSIVSDYRFRGISQTDTGPAIQGGIDYSHSSGFYLGNWNSSVTEQSFNDAAGIEMDFYGGFKFPIGDVTMDVGALYYYYPRADIDGTGEDYNTLEAYIGASYGPFSGKIWYAVTDWFGVNEETAGDWVSGDTDGSIYYEVNAAFPLDGGWTVVGHVGYQAVKNDGSSKDLDYFDWKLGFTYDYSGWLLGAAVVGSDAEDGDGEFYNLEGNSLSDTTVVVSISKTF